MRHAEFAAAEISPLKGNDVRLPMHKALVGVGLAAVGLAACHSAAAPANPAPPPSSTGKTLPSHGAPAVLAPIASTAAVESDPCSAIAPAQVEGLGTKVVNTAPEGDQTGKSCVWTYAGEYGTINAGLTPGNKDGLSSLYASSKDGTLTSFAPLPPVDGYPAVTYAQGGEGEGVCTLAVGVRDDLLYTVITRLDTGNPHRFDPCGVAAKIAGFGIQHLKAA